MIVPSKSTLLLKPTLPPSLLPFLPDRWALVSFLYFIDSSKPLREGGREGGRERSEWIFL